VLTGAPEKESNEEGKAIELSSVHLGRKNEKGLGERTASSSPTGQHLLLLGKPAYKTIYQVLVILTAVPASGKVLEDSIRLSSIRKTKLTLYVIQAAMLIALAILLIFVLGNASISPVLYLPLNSFIAVMVLLLLLLCLESFFFRILEIRFARSSSARHLMAKNSIKKSVLVAIVTGIFAMMLAVPSVRGGIENYGTTTTDVSPNTEALAFYSSDVFALISVVDVQVTASKEVQVYLLEDSVYRQYSGDKSMGDYFTFRLNTNNYNVTPGSTTTITVPSSGDYVKYRLVLNVMLNQGTSATIVIEKQMSSTFTGIVSLLLIAFLVTNIAWVAYLMPIERKYSVGSIYK
jgi:hypothetical protein